MTQTPNDGEWAFPHPHTNPGYVHGMTLRDWFAGQALTQMTARLSHPNDVVRAAYAIADAMLAARSK